MNKIENLICQLTVGDAQKIEEALCEASAGPLDLEQEKRFKRMASSYKPADEILQNANLALLENLKDQNPAAQAALNTILKDTSKIVKPDSLTDKLAKLALPLKKRVSAFLFRYVERETA